MSSTFDPKQVAGGGQRRQLAEVLKKCKTMLEKKAERREVRKKSTEGRNGHKSRPPRDLYLQGASTKSQLPRDLYLQGSSSFTDLTSRRAEHENMIRGTVAMGTVRKHSSSDILNSGVGASQTSPTGFGFGRSLDRVKSMESGIAFSAEGSGRPAMARASSHSTLQQSIRPFSGSMENIRTSLHSLQPRKRAPSVMRLDSAASDQVTQQMNVLEEKMELLARQFLYERQDMFKQIMRTCK